MFYTLAEMLYSEEQDGLRNLRGYMGMINRTPVGKNKPISIAQKREQQRAQQQKADKAREVIFFFLFVVRFCFPFFFCIVLCFICLSPTLIFISLTKIEGIFL